MKYRATTAEKAGFILNSMSDYQIHCVIRYGIQLDSERLERAYYLALASEPALSTRLVMNWLAPYWQAADPAPESSTAFTIVQDATQLALHDYICTPFDSYSSPQVHVRLFRGQGDDQGDTVCIKFNHLLSDAAGVREFAYAMVDIYNRLATDADYQPAVRTGTRSLKQVSRQFSLTQKLALIKRFIKDELLKRSWQGWGRMPEPAGEMENEFIFRRFESPEFRAINQYGKQRGATLNDMFMAAIYRAMHKVLPASSGNPLCMMSTVDLRRYMPGGVMDSIGTYSGFVYSGIGKDIGKNFDDTLRMVKAAFDAHKTDYMGLGDWVALSAMFKALPFALSKGLLIKLTMDNAFGSDGTYGCLTNMGRFDKDALMLDGNSPTDAYTTAPIAHIAKVILLGISGFGESLTLSAGLRATASERAVINNLLDAFIAELAACTAQQA